MATTTPTNQREESLRARLAENKARAREPRTTSVLPDVGSQERSPGNQISRAASSSSQTNMASMNAAPSAVRLSLLQNQQRTTPAASTLTANVTKTARKLALRLVIMGLVWLGGILFFPLLVGGGALLIIYAALH